MQHKKNLTTAPFQLYISIATKKLIIKLQPFPNIKKKKKEKARTKKTDAIKEF